MNPLESVNEARKMIAEMLGKAGVVLTPEDYRNLEVTDFGLGKLCQSNLT